MSAALVLAMTLAGCSFPASRSFFGRAVTEISLNRAVLAFFVDPQHSETTGLFGQSGGGGSRLAAELRQHTDRGDALP